VPCVAAARPSRPSRWAQTETPGYPGRKRESPRWCAVRSRIVHCARLTACIATLATAAKALVAARAAGWPLPAPLRCMEGDSEPIATAFHGCRSEAGADRARGRVVLVPSERVMPEPGDLLDVGEEKRSFGAEHVRVRCGYPRCFVPGVCDDPRLCATVLIVDDHTDFRCSARSLLEPRGSCSLARPRAVTMVEFHAGELRLACER
jgi:hypothetical protein